MTQATDTNRPGLLGVHVLSEHVFCHRAGLNAYLQDSHDDGRDPSILRLDFQPLYELLEIEKRLNAIATVLWQLAAVAVGFFVLGLLLAYLIHWSFFWGGLVTAVVVALCFIRELPEVFSLLRQHRAACIAVAIEPNPLLKDDEPVDWWSLRAAGLIPQPCDDLLVDDHLGLVGRPWRILRRGDLAIPAFVRKSPDEIKPQQRLRIAAYCHLIIKNEGAQSPYGVILDHGTFKGTAVKPNDDDTKQLHRALNHVPNIVEAYLGHGLTPEPPRRRSICRYCPHGRPQELKPGKSDTLSAGQVVPPYALHGTLNRRIYHSPCGDRFGWSPPHADAHALGLPGIPFP